MAAGRHAVIHTSDQLLSASNSADPRLPQHNAQGLGSHLQSRIPRLLVEHGLDLCLPIDGSDSYENQRQSVLYVHVFS